jgi:hypothetical protein
MKWTSTQLQLSLQINVHCGSSLALSSSSRSWMLKLSCWSCLWMKLWGNACCSAHSQQQQQVQVPGPVQELLCH